MTHMRRELAMSWGGTMIVTIKAYESWLMEVEAALSSINMLMSDWQTHWAFDFGREFNRGTTPTDTAMKANRFWWYQQNKAIGKECRKTSGCWLPSDHQGHCKLVVEEIHG